ncbi:MAG: AbrB/MazE/SpoVT family DNA-binding domain-containing protein [Chloroflexota bacterium]|nr:AbrB/MazE/SpoVT family DNA-binding domain-containing protein [Chloroflexota bacterium]
MPSVVGQRGQIVIEKPIRDALGLEPGYLAVQRLVADHVELHFYPPEHEESLRGVLASKAKRSVPPEKWAEVREEAWSKAVRLEWMVDEGTA